MDTHPTIDDYWRAPAHPLRITGGRRAAGYERVHHPEQPLVTVLTVVLNRKKTLPQAINSVLNQTYPNIEYIIIDGASTDGTLDVLKQFDDNIDLWISEPDLGIADAVNKAVSYARGDFITWVPSDDWADQNFVKFAVETLVSSDADFVFGDVTLYRNETPELRVKGDQDYSSLITFRLPRIHFQSMVIKKECFQKAGLLDVTYKISTDFEWALRLHLCGAKGGYDGRLNAYQRAGGVTEQLHLQGVVELLKALRQHGLLTPRAMAGYLYYGFVRRKLRRLAKLFLPNSIYQSLVRFARRSYSVPLD